MKFGCRGQSAWFDILIIFLSLMIFTSLMYAYTLTAKSPGTNNQMRMQDYTQSMLIRTLYTTYSPTDPADRRYEGKSISDFMAMYLTNNKAFVPENKPPQLLRVAIQNMVSSPDFKSRPEYNLEWFIFESEKKEFCFHIIGGQVLDCPPEAVQSNAFTSAIADIFYAAGSAGGLPPIGFSDPLYSQRYGTKKVKLTIIWARAS